MSQSQPLPESLQLPSLLPLLPSSQHDNSNPQNRKQLQSRLSDATSQQLKTVFYNAIRNGNLALVRYMQENGFLSAARGDNNNKNASHTDSNSNSSLCNEPLNSNGDTAIMLSVRYGHLKMTEYLLNETDSDPLRENLQGDTCINIAEQMEEEAVDYQEKTMQRNELREDMLILLRREVDMDAKEPYGKQTDSSL